MTCIERCQGYMVENHWLKIIYNMHSAQLVHALSEYWGLTTNSELCYSFPTKLHKMSMQINLISFCSVWLLCLVYHMSVYWNYLNSLVLTIPIFNKLFVNINLNSYIPSFLFYIFTKLEKQCVFWHLPSLFMCTEEIQSEFLQFSLDWLLRTKQHWEKQGQISDLV